MSQRPAPTQEAWHPRRWDGPPTRELPGAFHPVKLEAPPREAQFPVRQTNGQTVLPSRPGEEHLAESTSSLSPEVLEQLKQEAFATGLAQGRAQGRAEAEAERRLEPVAAVASLVDQIRRESRDVLIELAHLIAERALKERIKRDPRWVIKNLEAVLNRRVPNGAVKLRLHPEDWKLLQALDPPPAFLGGTPDSLTFVADPSLQPGDCVLESDRMRIDGRVDVQLDQLREFLREVVAGVLFSEAG